MKTNLKLQLLSNTRITSGVSFKAIKLLNKQYSSFFNKMTLGFECEIAVPEVDLDEYYGGSDDFDTDSLRPGFEEQFSFDQAEFLTSLNIDANTRAGLFSIEPLYGFAQDKFEKPLKSLMSLADKIGFKVMGQTLSDESLYMRAPDSGDYNPGDMHQFAYQDTDLYNVQLAINKAKEHLDLYVKFLHKYSIHRSRNNYTDKIYGALEDLDECIKDLGKALTSSDPIHIRKLIWLTGKHINKFRVFVNYLIRAIQSEGEDTAIWVVLNKDGECEVVSLEKWDEDGGILSPSLEFDADEDSPFDEMFAQKRQARYQEAWDEYVENAQGESGASTSSKSGAISQVYNAVIRSVDPGAIMSTEYHDSDISQHRGKRTIVESDSSIEPQGAEVVSKVFTGPKDGLEWLNKVFDMIENNDMVTNSSTGLHVNLGTFRVMHRAKLDAQHGINLDKPVIDVLKLAVLSGDHYLLDQFGRFGNTYASPMASNINAIKESGFDFRKASQGFVFNGEKVDLWGSITDLNRRFLAGQGERYKTINMQNLVDKGYLEFRIAGGENYHADSEKVKKAVYRYMQLCAIACDPQAYFKEYMTELYQWFVDKHNINDPVVVRNPKPKNVQEALHVVRLWNSKYSIQGNGPLNQTALAIVKNAVLSNEHLRETDVLDMIAGLNATDYAKIDSNFLYAIRLLMLFAVKGMPNGKQYLLDTWNKHRQSIGDYIAPKLYKNKPQWVKFFFTGTGLVGNQTIESGLMNTKGKIKLLAKTKFNKKVQAATVPDDATTYTLKVNDGDKSLLKLLQAIQKLGAEGSSRSISIEDFEGPNKFGFDGDGADKIYDIQTGDGETIEADENADESTDNYSYELTLKVREFNTYGTIENMLENLKAQTDIGLLTTVNITNSNGFIGKFQIGGENKDQLSKFGTDTILSIDKKDNPNLKIAYHNPDPEEDS
jgi:hypothetical protein